MPKPVTYCSVDGCTSRCHGRGLCRTHYKRWRKHGDTETVKRVYRGPDICTVPGCDRSEPTRRGMCTLHYQRWAKTGDPEVVQLREYPSGPDHHAWTDEPAYRTVHARLDREQGSATSHRCAVCNDAAEQWAYDHNDPDERIGVVSGGAAVPYSVKPEHYRPLCHACHRRVDLRSLRVVA